MSQRRAPHHWLLVALLLAAARAPAADPALLGQDLGIEAPQRFIEDWVVAPIPISNPTIGTGLAVVAMPFYHLGEGSPLSNTMLATGYTSSGSWGVAAAQSTRLRGDRMRIDGMLAYGELHYRFYGIGDAAGEGGSSVPIVQKAALLAPELLFNAGARTFLGLRYRGLRVETAPEAASALIDSITITSSGFGPRATLDTRDNEMSPSSGVLVDVRANFADEAFGSDFNYETWELSGNYYRRAGPGVMALRAYACHASERTPLFDLCLFGANNDLRGYEVGRYRDRAMFAAQGEYRFPLGGRWGGVLFGGWGKVAPSFGEMDEQLDLPSIGAGLRWLAAEKAKVNLSIDVARARDSTSLYVYVKESF